MNYQDQRQWKKIMLINIKHPEEIYIELFELIK